MQPWDQVQVIDTADARNGDAGLVISAKLVADGTRDLTVRFDKDGATAVYHEAQLKLLGR
jgi:hypothetical protein